MDLIDLLFVLILKFSSLAFVLLAVGVGVLRHFKQPLERIRLIQVSLLSVFVAGLLGSSAWVPSLELAWLPADPQPAAEGISAPANPRDVYAIQGTSREAVEMVSAMPQASGAPTESVSLGAPDSTVSAIDVAAVAPVTRMTRWEMIRSVFTVGFLAVCLLSSIHLLCGSLLTRRLVASSIPLKDSDHKVIGEFQAEADGRPVRLAMSPKISVPIVSGLYAPTIVLPQQLLSGNGDPIRIRHSLDHEFKHIERMDLLTWQLASALQVLLWPQPFYWLLRRELRISQDQIADQFATRRRADQVAYATTLVEFSKARHSALLGALTMAGTKSNLYRRVEMLLNTDFNIAGCSRKRIVVGFAGLMAAASLLLVSLQLTRADAADTPQTPTGELESGAEDAKAKAKELREAERNATQPAEHSGFVLDALDQKPVENATVIVTRMRSDTWEEIGVTECQTDANGQFVFTVPVEQLKQRYLYILFDLRHATYAPRHCGSYSYGMIRKNLELGAEPWFKKLQMVSGQEISGRFVDKQGVPVAGAAVRIKSRTPSVNGLEGQSSSKAVTGEDGRFEAIVTAEGDASVSVIPLEHCMKHVDLGKKRGDVGDITLNKGMPVTGKVLDAAGAPVEGVWVNLTESQTRNGASYEAKRSTKTDATGSFQTRPVSPGKYEVSVEMKATGALEKVKYANFFDNPPPAMFVNQTIDVTEEERAKPFVIQAVPHIYISGQCYSPQGEITRCHFPSLMGKFNGQFMWIRAKKGDQVGQFQLIVPHGVEAAELSFTTNEHSSLMVQFSGKQPSPQRAYKYETLEEDIADIKVVRYVAPIVQVKLVGDDGNQITDGRVYATYPQFADPEQKMMRSPVIRYFEKQDDGVFRSSSLVPDLEFEIVAEKPGFVSEPVRMTMKEAATNVITVEMEPSDKNADKSDVGESRDRVSGVFQVK